MRNLLLTALLFTMLYSCEKEIQPSKEAVTNSSEVSTAKVKNKRIYFTSQGNWVGSGFSYNSGDTFVLKAGIAYTYFSMGNINNVTIINEGGKVTLSSGFNLANCTNIHIVGTGYAKQTYGFEISNKGGGGAGVGIDINGKSKSIIVSNVYIHDKTYGFWVKQEVGNTCDASLYYPKWYMDSIEIYKCMIKKVGQEGMYLGSTGQNADRPNGCGQYPYPLRLGNVSVHDNIIDSTGRSGIQLSGADRGSLLIYKNKITRCGYELNDYQGFGVVIGGNARAYIHDNTIKNTLCDGVWVLGCGFTWVYNNSIDSSGWLAGKTASGMQGISFDVRPSYPFKLSRFIIQGNTIGKHSDKSDIYIYNTMQNNKGVRVSGFSATGNGIYNNNKGKAIIAVQSGIVYSTKPVSN